MTTKDPFDVKLSEDQEREVTDTLVNAIRDAKNARAQAMQEGGWIDFFYSLYEQQSQKGISRDRPRYGGADLTSPIGTENVDSLAARAIKTMFTAPFWIVEGVGKSAKQAPVVEEFMQMRQEQIRLQTTAKKVCTSAFVEYGSVIEVCEDTERIVKREQVKAKVATDALGNMVLDGKTGKPIPQYDEQGAPIPTESDEEPFVEVMRTWTDYKARGAYVRRRGMKDFVFLPSHAEDMREVWGHANRFFLTLGTIKRGAEDGEYKKKNVDLLGGHSQEREQRTEHDRAGVTVEVNHGSDYVEKELWRVQFWADLGKGYTFYTAIVSEIHDCILSLKYDWLQRFRTVYVNPYPCPYSVYGYSMIGTKLLTTIEEHTARRNQNADRGTLKANAPLKRLHNAHWDPAAQPFGAGEVIDVGDMNEVQPFEFEDVSPQAMQAEQQPVVDAQRIIGLNDIAIGQQSRTSRTLGENQMATQQSFVRTDDPIGNIQEAFEEVGELIHAIEVQALKAQEGPGMDASQAVTQTIQYRGDPSFQGTFTAQMLDGQFTFKPRGSVEDADPNRRQQNMVNGLAVLSKWAQLNPEIARRMQSPPFADALMQMWVTEFKPRDRQAFLAPLPPPPMPMGMPGMGPEGMPPGAPPGAPGAAPEGGPSFGGEQVLQQLLAKLPQGAPS